MRAVSVGEPPHNGHARGPRRPSVPLPTHGAAKRVDSIFVAERAALGGETKEQPSGGRSQHVDPGPVSSLERRRTTDASPKNLTIDYGKSVLAGRARMPISPEATASRQIAAGESLLIDAVQEDLNDTSQFLQRLVGKLRQSMAQVEDAAKRKARVQQSEQAQQKRAGILAASLASLLQTAKSSTFVDLASSRHARAAVGRAAMVLQEAVLHGIAPRDVGPIDPMNPASTREGALVRLLDTHDKFQDNDRKQVLRIDADDAAKSHRIVAVFARISRGAGGATDELREALGSTQSKDHAVFDSALGSFDPQLHENGSLDASTPEAAAAVLRAGEAAMRATQHQPDVAQSGSTLLRGELDASASRADECASDAVQELRQHLAGMDLRGIEQRIKRLRRKAMEPEQRDIQSDGGTAGPDGLAASPSQFAPPEGAQAKGNNLHPSPLASALPHETPDMSPQQHAASSSQQQNSAVPASAVPLQVPPPPSHDERNYGLPPRRAAPRPPQAPASRGEAQLHGEGAGPPAARRLSAALQQGEPAPDSAADKRQQLLLLLEQLAAAKQRQAAAQQARDRQLQATQPGAAHARPHTPSQGMHQRSRSSPRRQRQASQVIRHPRSHSRPASRDSRHAARPASPGYSLQPRPGSQQEQQRHVPRHLRKTKAQLHRESEVKDQTAERYRAASRRLPRSKSVGRVALGSNTPRHPAGRTRSRAGSMHSARAGGASVGSRASSRSRTRGPRTATTVRARLDSLRHRLDNGDISRSEYNAQRRAIAEQQRSRASRLHRARSASPRRASIVRAQQDAQRIEHAARGRGQQALLPAVADAADSPHARLLQISSAMQQTDDGRFHELASLLRSVASQQAVQPTPEPSASLGSVANGNGNPGQFGYAYAWNGKHGGSLPASQSEQNARQPSASRSSQRAPADGDEGYREPLLAHDMQPAPPIEGDFSYPQQQQGSMLDSRESGAAGRGPTVTTETSALLQRAAANVSGMPLLDGAPFASRHPAPAQHGLAQQAGNNLDSALTDLQQYRTQAASAVSPPRPPSIVSNGSATARHVV